VQKNTRTSYETLFNRTNPLKLWCTILKNMHQLRMNFQESAPRMNDSLLAHAPAERCPSDKE
jgi:hypothetical protein